MPIKQSLQASGKVGVDQALADWVFEAGIPFNVFRTPAWQIFTQHLGKYEEDCLRERLLKDARQRVDADLGPFWLDAEYTDVTLMSDRWTDPSHRPLINVLAATPKGSCFLFAKNCEGKVKNAEFTADVWSKGMEQVGPDMCHCLVVDGASVNTAAARIFEDRYKHVSVVKCVAHSLDLMLEDIYKLFYFSGVITDQKRVVRFITNHHYSPGLFRQFAPKQLLKTTETRFYGAYIVARRILEIQSALMQTAVSQEWAHWAKSPDKTLREEAAAVKALVLDEAGFWGKLEVMVDVFEPVVKLLQLVDSQVPSASKVYFYMSRLDGQISNSSLPQRLKPDVKDIVKKRCEYDHSHIHPAGFCLDPDFWQLNLNQEVREGQFIICKKIVGEEGAIQCMLQLEAFRRRKGCFGSQRALAM